MKTVVLRGDLTNDIERAATALRGGELVAFPTETVYGLGANALDPHAVAKIFEAKGRPPTNPLISHVSSVEAARGLAGEWPVEAQKLAQKFWPGPLTLIVPRGPQVPGIVSAGLASMGIRMPDHPVALALIEAANRPIAAPSANRYTEVSPTTAQHVVTGLGGRIPYVLDGGATTVGIESTVLSLVDRIPTILRPGAVTAADIALEIGRVEVAAPQIPDDQSRPSPGLSRRHYAPAVPLEIVDAMPGGDVLGDRDVVIVRKSPGDTPARVVVLGDSAANWARELYALLHRFGAEDIDRIVVERPPESEEWRAIRDRLERAASFE